jgi:multiple sugar transport system substrate-binding protein
MHETARDGAGESGKAAEMAHETFDAARRDRERQHRDMLEWYARSRASRRALVKGAAGLGLGAAGLVATAPRPAVAAPVITPGPRAAARLALQDGADSAQVAIDALNAMENKPEVLNVVWEDGLQLEDPSKFSGPMFEELTGIRINPVGRPFPDLFASQVAEHLAGTGAFDVLSMVPSWTADFVSQGVVEPLDGYIDEYMNPADLEDFHPLYKELMNYGGQRYGIFDDGDVIVLYYRTDLFEDQANKDAFQAQYNRELAPPKDWTEYDEVQAFFTEQGGGQTFGGASQRAPGQVFGWFSEEFRNRGGRFFDDETLDAAIASEVGVETLNAMVARNATMPPGVETWGFIEVLTAWMSGQLAMIGGTWPPIGRWSEGTTAEQLAWVPETTVAGKVGYSVMPMGHSLHNAGFNLAVSADSPNKEAAYLFIQWMTSPSVSLQRVMLPYALRDPYRLSHFASEEYRARWENAGAYLDTLQAIADTALIDLIMPGSAEYYTAIDQAVTAAQAGTPVEQALADGAAAMNAVTDRVGRDAQKEAYANFKALKGAYYEE